jgi:hypothetical protein
MSNGIGHSLSLPAVATSLSRRILHWKAGSGDNIHTKAVWVLPVMLSAETKDYGKGYGREKKIEYPAGQPRSGCAETRSGLRPAYRRNCICNTDKFSDSPARD